MTICATEAATASDSPHRAALTIAADGSYAARLARHDDAAGSWFPERWTLSGPEPYAVPLQGTQPEEPDSALLPLTDGRVLILRRVADRFAVSLLYPAGPGTGELLLGAVPAPELTLLPPAPGGTLGYALAPEARTTTLWLLHGGADGPERVTRIPGRCTGGVWLDRSGRLLALDRELDGRTKTVVVDLERGGETGLLLQICLLYAAARRSGQRAAARTVRRTGARPAGLGRIGQQPAGALPGVPAARGGNSHPVRGAAGADAGAGELRGGVPQGGGERYVAGHLAALGAAVAALPGAGGVAGRGRTVDGRRRTAAAVRHGGGAVRGGADGCTAGAG